MRKIITLLFLVLIATMTGNAQNLTFTTSKNAGNSITIGVVKYSATTGTETILIDWGDGIQESHSVPAGGSSGIAPQSITKVLPVDQPTIKVYGNLYKLVADNQSLTSFEINQSSFLTSIKLNNNQLPKVLGLSYLGGYVGEIRLHNNLFTPCPIEEMYNEISIQKQNLGALFMVNSNQIDAQHQYVIDSKISIVNGRGYRVTDAAFPFSTAWNNPITETTGIGCLPTDVDKILENSINIFVDGKNIFIKNSKSDLNIYDVSGKLIHSRNSNATSSEFTYTFNNSGIYFIKSENKSHKVIIQ